MLSKHIAWKSREQMKIQKEYLKIKWKKIVKVLDRYLYKEVTQWPLELLLQPSLCLDYWCKSPYFI